MILKQCTFEFCNSPPRNIGWVYITHGISVSHCFDVHTLLECTHSWKNEFMYVLWAGEKLEGFHRVNEGRLFLESLDMVIREQRDILCNDGVLLTRRDS